MTPVRANLREAKVGDVLPDLDFTFSLTSLVKYAGATWDFHRYHYDPEFVRKIGIPAPFADGQMLGALLARMVVSWAGTDAFLRRLAYRQSATVYMDEAITLGGRVRDTFMEDGAPSAEIVMSAVKSDGTVVIRDAVAMVRLASLAPDSGRAERIPFGVD